MKEIVCHDIVRIELVSNGKPIWLGVWLMWNAKHKGTGSEGVPGYRTSMFTTRNVLIRLGRVGHPGLTPPVVTPARLHGSECQVQTGQEIVAALSALYLSNLSPTPSTSAHSVPEKHPFCPWTNFLSKQSFTFAVTSWYVSRFWVTPLIPYQVSAQLSLLGDAVSVQMVSGSLNPFLGDITVFSSISIHLSDFFAPLKMFCLPRVERELQGANSSFSFTFILSTSLDT